MSEPQSERFCMNPKPYLIGVVVAAYAIFVLVIVARLIWDQLTNGRATMWELRNTTAMQYILLAAFVQFWIIVLVLFTIWRMALTVGPGGLRTFNSFGRPIVLPWTEPITAIVAKRTLGFHTVELLTAAGRKYVLPGYRWMYRPIGFARAIAKHAGPEHVLTVWMNASWSDPYAD
jgi:hypothetical protein